MMEAGKGMRFTFHRAIDVCNNPFEIIETLIDLGFDKVLTSGCKPTAYEGIDMIKEFQTRFGDRINIMAGGGIKEDNIERILSATGINNCHASLASQVIEIQDDIYPDKTLNEVKKLKVSDVNRVKDIVSVISTDA